MKLTTHSAGMVPCVTIPEQHRRLVHAKDLEDAEAVGAGLVSSAFSDMG